MTKVFIIHGAYGSPRENWFPWLKSELEKLNCEVFVPEFPTPENQSLENWEKVFAKYENQIDSETIFVGHSLAPAFLLSVLERINTSIKCSFFVSSFIRFLDNKDFDIINRTFVDKKFNWQKIKENCKKFFIYHSDNDPYVPIECAYEIANPLGVKVEIIKDAGHFNQDAGYTKFERLLDDIKSIL
jgi:uncharacterized protein